MSLLFWQIFSLNMRNKVFYYYDIDYQTDFYAYTNVSTAFYITFCHNYDIYYLLHNWVWELVSTIGNYVSNIF